VIFPEYLYKLSSRDQQVTWLDPRFDALSVAAAAASVQSTLRVPDGRVLVLSAAVVDAIAGAAQTLDRIVLFCEPPDPSTISFRISGGIFAASVEQFVTWTGQLVIPPNWKVAATARFNAGVAANTVALSLAGILIPVGNIQRV
jgi:hypothetical protein